MSRPDILARFDEHGVLATPQRVEIANILFEKAQHLSAEQIIDRLRVSGSAVSKATVYNTLNLFGECGLVRECIVDRERRFYDSTSEPHHHFYDLDTGELTDIPDDQIQFAKLPELPGDGQIDGVEVIIKIRNGKAENRT